MNGHAHGRTYRRPAPTYLRRMLYSPQHSKPREGFRDALNDAADAVRAFVNDTLRALTRS